MDPIEELKRRGLIVTGERVKGEGERLSSGIDELDRVGGGGLPRGAVTEVVGPDSGGAPVM
jgi:RecA/RadA recombinase